MAVLEKLRSHGHRGLGAAVALKGALAMAGVGPATVPIGPVTFDNVEQRLEQAAHGNSAGQTKSQATSDLLLGGALVGLRREERQNGIW